MPALPRTYAKGLLVIECRDPAVLREVNAARETGLGSLADSSITHAVFPNFPARNWQVAWLQTDMEMITVAVPAPKR